METAPQPWSYAAEFSLGIPAGREGPGFVRVDVLVTSGPIGVGLLNLAETDFLFRISLNASGEPQSIDLAVSDFRQLGRLVIQNWDTPGPHSARVRSVTTWGLR